MNRVQAILFLGYLLGRIGPGYHPDTPISDYISGTTNQDLFHQEEVEQYQLMHDKMLTVLDYEEVCDTALSFFERPYNPR